VLLIVPFALALSAPAAAVPLADSAILLIGDGMGAAQIAVAREARGGDPLAMETAPVSGLMTTHSADRAITDSAAAGTALATGHKTNNGMISVTPDGRRVVTILERCRAMYKATGIITTDSLHGATPASFAAHAESRGMRSEIALQMAESGVPVMMGFWKGWFLPKSAGGEREDGRDLIAKMRGDGYAVAFTREQLFEASGPRLLGLFDDGAQAPTLAEMVGAALQQLSDEPGGFFLIVEGARIDWKCHGNDPAGAVLDTWEFDEAVAAALALARTRGRTLVVITADHETGGLTIDDRTLVRRLGSVRASCEAMTGKLNSDRSNAAQVLADFAGVDNLTGAELTTLNGAEDAEAAIAALISERAGVSWTTGGHTDTPVRVLAFGPGADRFAGEMDNTDIPKRIAEVLGIGAFPE
jgi:alkaline phosphatase